MMEIKQEVDGYNKKTNDLLKTVDNDCISTPQKNVRKLNIYKKWVEFLIKANNDWINSYCIQRKIVYSSDTDINMSSQDETENVKRLEQEIKNLMEFAQSTCQKSESALAALNDLATSFHNLKKQNLDLSKLHQTNESHYSEKVQELQNGLKLKNSIIERLEWELKQRDDASNNQRRGEIVKANKCGRLKSLKKHFEFDLTDMELDDEQKITYLQEGTKAMSNVIRQKQKILREQKSKIEQLYSQLQEQNMDYEAAEVLRKNLKKMELKNSNLLMECDKLRDVINCSQMELVSSKTEQQRKTEIINRKLTLQEEQIKTLLAERQELMAFQMKLLRSISVCQNEFEQYSKYTHRQWNSERVFLSFLCFDIYDIFSSTFIINLWLNLCLIQEHNQIEVF